MNNIRNLIYFNAIISIIAGILTLLPSFPLNAITELAFEGFLLSAILYLLTSKYKNSFVIGVVFSYSLINISFLFCVIQIFFVRTQEILLGYQFAILEIMALPIIIVGGFIGIVIAKIINHKKRT